MAEDYIGRILGKYELRERIGRGGMAEVYKAYHATLDRHVAIKVLHPFLGEDPEFKERFEREARNVAQLRHPNIVQVYDFDFDTTLDLYYMVMEFIDGPTLRTRLMQLNFQGERFTIMEAVRIARDMAGALAYAHKRDMIHRDIKPGNIMLDSDGRVVLTDFGIARIVSGPHMTASGSMVGTPAYISPEQGLGQTGDHRSDIYSLGVVLYQMVTGTTPFDADTPIAIVLKHVNDPLPAPSGMNPDIPEGLERVLYKALAKSPDDRYQSVEEMTIHLDNLDAASTLVLPAVSAIQKPASVAAPSAALAEVGKALTWQSGCLMWIVLLILSLGAMGSGIYFSFTGLLSEVVPFAPSVDIVLTETPTMTAAPTIEELPIDTPAPDLQATGISLTMTAFPTLVSTPSLSPTPDLTATILACDYDYEVIRQAPEDGIAYPELTSVTKRITIVNDSRCPLDDDTRLVFFEGFQLDGPDFVEFNQELQPGEEFEIVLELRTPALTNPSNPVVRSVWLIMLPDDTQVGPPLSFEFRLLKRTDDSNTGSGSSEDEGDS